MTDDELRSALKTLGLNQLQLSERIGVTPLTVLRWVHGRTAIPTPVALLIRVLESGRVSLDDLEAIRRLWEVSPPSFTPPPRSWT